MQYMGSKSRFASDIISVILGQGKSYSHWVEPFVGGANVIDKITGSRIGSDNNRYLIALLKALQTGWEPPDHVSEELYYAVKQRPSKYPDHQVGFISICCSFSGRGWDGGYARSYDKRTGELISYCGQQRRNLLKQAPALQGVEFIHCDYRELSIPPTAVVYCDPPYAGVKKYAKNFDHAAFWDWVRKLPNDVYVSEYNAPDDFECVWSKEAETTIRPDVSRKAAVEKLFRRR